MRYINTRLLLLLYTRRTLRPSSSPYTPYTWPAAPRPVAVGAKNIHDEEEEEEIYCG